MCHLAKATFEEFEHCFCSFSFCFFIFAHYEKLLEEWNGNSYKMMAWRIIVSSSWEAEVVRMWIYVCVCVQPGRKNHRIRHIHYVYCYNGYHTIVVAFSPLHEWHFTYCYYISISTYMYDMWNTYSYEARTCHFFFSLPPSHAFSINLFIYLGIYRIALNTQHIFNICLLRISTNFSECVRYYSVIIYLYTNSQSIDDGKIIRLFFFGSRWLEWRIHIFRLKIYANICS